MPEPSTTTSFMVLSPKQVENARAPAAFTSATKPFPVIGLHACREFSSGKPDLVAPDMYTFWELSTATAAGCVSTEAPPRYVAYRSDADPEAEGFSFARVPHASAALAQVACSAP